LTELRGVMAAAGKAEALGPLDENMEEDEDEEKDEVGPRVGWAWIAWKGGASVPRARARLGRARGRSWRVPREAEWSLGTPR
jgi:hypothetical protein